MTLDIIKLYFKTPLHLSKGKLNTYEDSGETLHSDTLKSAIFAAALQLPGDGFDTAEFFNSFRVSSAFPFFGEEIFFPKPAYAPNLRHSDRKWLKKIQWLGKGIFQKILNGEQVDLMDGDLAFDKKAASDTLSPAQRGKKFFEKEKTQRVKIPRMGEEGDSMPFYLDKLYFRKETGLFFIVHWQDKKYERLFNSALKLLGDNGIGLQRNLGNGCFEATSATASLDLPANGNAAVSLSLYCPLWEGEWDMLDLEKSAYRFVKRGGWISTGDVEHLGYRKRSVQMLEEGCVLPFGNLAGLETKGEGCIDLTPEILEDQATVWRDGTGMFLPIHFYS